MSRLTPLLPFLFALAFMAFTSLACTEPVTRTPDTTRVHVNQAEIDRQRSLDATIEAHRRGWDQVIESNNNAQMRDWDAFNRSTP